MTKQQYRDAKALIEDVSGWCQWFWKSKQVDDWAICASCGQSICHEVDMSIDRQHTDTICIVYLKTRIEDLEARIERLEARS